MFEKVNPSHPDKIADRIAGAIVDIAYETQIDPKIAVEVLIGHGVCHAIVETSAKLNIQKVKNAIYRIAGNVKADVVIVPQDAHLARSRRSITSSWGLAPEYSPTQFSRTIWKISDHRRLA